MVFLTALVVLAGAAPSPASAHGGFFRVHEILFGPDDPDFIVLRSDVWGTALSRDGGDSWQWLCAESYGRTSTTPRRIAMQLGAGQRILAASLGEGLFVSDGDPCEWQALPQFEDELVRDLKRLPDGRLLALSSRSDEMGSHTTLWESQDEGESWSMLGSEVPEGIAGISVGAAPSDPQRLYVTARGIESVRVARSSDGGESWQLTSFAFAIDALTFEPRVAGVDPNDPDRVYLLIDATSGMGNQDAADSVLVSTDGGASFATLLTSPGDLPAFAFSPDGTRIAVGGVDEGLIVADAQEAASGDPNAFDQSWPGQIYSLRWTEDGLYAGGDDWSQEPLFSMGVSQDEGISFEQTFSLCEVTLLECDPSSRAGQLCPGQFSDMGEGAGALKEDFLDSDRCQGAAAGDDASVPADAAMPPRSNDGGAGSDDAGTAREDAGAEGNDAAARDSASNGSGCSCRVSGAQRVSDFAALMAACAWLLRRRRHRPV